MKTTTKDTQVGGRRKAVFTPLFLGTPGGPIRNAFAMLLILACSGATLGAALSRPNIILILADDLGWSDLGCYGGEIRTPTLDRLAANGIRFTQFYNSAKCEPTRASLMSGQYWQDCGLGIKRGITMGQAMQAAGYATLAVGKWHLDGDPIKRGFDQYFGHLSGASDYFKGSRFHRLNGKPFAPKDNKFYTTDANADFAIQFIEASRRRNPDQPFFLYLAFNAPHNPLQAWPEDIARYRGQYRAGWDAIRRQRYERMLAVGLVRREWALPPRPDTVPAWDSMQPEERDFEDQRMAIYAAMVDRMDQAIGRVIAALKSLGQEENTLVMFLSDNGGNPYDLARAGKLPDRDAHWQYGLGWASVSNTPFRHYKRNMYNGGICTPFIVSWPSVIRPAGTIIDHRAHIIDLMPTLADLAGWEWPAQFRGQDLRPLPGKSLRPVLEGRPRAEHAALYFQLMDHRAVIAGDWKLASDWGRPWELFDLRRDRTEMRNLSRDQPERFHELEALFQNWWAAKLPALVRPAGGEPTYRHWSDETESSQGRTSKRGKK